MITTIFILAIHLAAFPIGTVLMMRMIDEWMTAEHWHLVLRLLVLLTLAALLVLTYFRIIAELFGAALAA